MTRSAKDRYIVDPDDGLRSELVGTWSPEKHLRLQRYVDITSATRAKFKASGATYIDLYCGPGRSRLRKTMEAMDGSSLVAATEAARRTAFTQLHIADLDTENVTSCHARLFRAGITNAVAHVGDAADTAARVVRHLHPNGLHLAFLDPYSIAALPFSVISTLASLKRMDFIVHVSLMDLQRNVKQFMLSGTLDAFAPGWRSVVNPSERNDLLVLAVFKHWRQLLADLGLFVSSNIERVTGEKNQPLYWLVLASRHPLADKFWAQVSDVQTQRRFVLT